jgi:hypothetical protein
VAVTECGQAVFSHCTFTGNRVDGVPRLLSSGMVGGGAIASSVLRLRLQHCRFEGNAVHYTVRLLTVSSCLAP